MWRKTAPLMLLLFLVSGVTHSAAEEIDLAAAEAQFQKSCGTCHTAEPNGANRQGPNLFGVYGQKVGRVEGFKYSEALLSGDWVWTEAELDPWIENAQKTHPGTYMNYRQRSAEKRALIIVYLKSLSSEN